jgi:hypothetical protein
VAAALHIVALFVVLLAPYFAFSYFVFTGDQRRQLGCVAGGRGHPVGGCCRHAMSCWVFRCSAGCSAGHVEMSSNRADRCCAWALAGIAVEDGCLPG